MVMNKRRVEILELVEQINTEEFKGKCIKTDKLINTLDFIGYQLTHEELDELHQLLIRVLDRMEKENV